MKIDLDNLPSDPKSLHKIIHILVARLEYLEQLLALMRKEKFGSSSEKRKSKNENEIEGEIEGEIEEEIEGDNKGKKGGESQDEESTNEDSDSDSDSAPNPELDTKIEALEQLIEDERMMLESIIPGILPSEETGELENLGLASELLTSEARSCQDQVSASESGSESASSNSENMTPPHKKKRSSGRRKLPKNLTTIDNVIDPAPICPECGSRDFRKISDDISYTLDYKPADFIIVRNIRPRVACKNCDSLNQAPPKSMPIDKGYAEAGLLSHILVQKYCNHLPLYRQSEIYKRESDIYISRSTMCAWSARAAKLLDRIVALLKEEIFSSSHIHSDDTTIRVLDRNNPGGVKCGRLWVYVRDGRSYDSKEAPAICYFYEPDRKGIRPEAHLKDFKGTLHADSYSGYDKVYNIKDEEGNNTIQEAACWAHTRRKFYEIVVSNKHAKLAEYALDKIGEIYKVEEEIRHQSPEIRQIVRNQKTKSIVNELFANWKNQYNNLSKTGATAKAIKYALNNEVALKRFIQDGKIEIDNNTAERSMRCIALGRKNYLFAGSDDGGKTAANIYSLIETAKLNNVNPWKYLKKVLSLIQDYNSQNLKDLMPWNLAL
jgi:transposase